MYLFSITTVTAQAAGSSLGLEKKKKREWLKSRKKV